MLFLVMIRGGSKTSSSHIGSLTQAQCGSVEYWLIFAAMSILLGGAALGFAIRGHRLHLRKAAASFEYLQNDVVWDYNAAVKVCFLLKVELHL